MSLLVALVLFSAIVQAQPTRERVADAAVDDHYAQEIKQRFRALGKRQRTRTRSAKSSSKKKPDRPGPPPSPPPPPSGPHTDCNFVFKYNDVKFFQVEEGGEIVNYHQVPSSSDLITICAGNKCAGEPQEVVGVATGNCIPGAQDRFSFTVATDENPTFVDFQVFCPDITWIGGGECVAIDINTEQPVIPFPNVTVTGPAMLVEDIQFDSLVQCELACTPRV